MKLLKTARKDRMGEAINAKIIKTVNVRGENDLYYVTVQLLDDSPTDWLVITNDLSLLAAQKAFDELIEVLSIECGYDAWTKKWIEFGNC